MFEISVDPSKAIDDLKNIRADQLPFAFSLGINNTAKGARDLMRTELTHDFTINPSRLAFLQSLIRFPRALWATKQKPIATLGVHQRDEDVGVGSSNDRGFLLGRHEEGGERTRTDESRPFFIPTKAIRSGDTDLPPRNLYPSALRLVESRGTIGYIVGPNGRRKAVKGLLAAQAHGKRDTFIVDARKNRGPNAWGIFQRFGPGPKDIRLIWAFRMKINLPPRLKFYATVDRYVAENFERHFSEAMDRAMRTAR